MEETEVVVIIVTEALDNNDILHENIQVVVKEDEDNLDSNKLVIAEQESNLCPICLEELQGENTSQTVKFICDHELHTPCAVSYVVDKLKKNKDIECPLCRTVHCCNSTTSYATMLQHFEISPQQSQRNEIIRYIDNRHTSNDSITTDNEMTIRILHFQLILFRCSAVIISVGVCVFLIYVIFAMRR